MKKFLLSAFAMLLALTAGAQNFTVDKSPNPLGVQTQAFGAFKAPAKANLAANQRLVGYYDDVDTCDGYVGLTGLTGDNKVAMQLTADDLAPYYGKKIAGVRFNLAQGETSNGVFVQNLTLENGQITDVKDLVSSDESVTSAAGATNTGEWHEVMFDNKIELNSSFEGLFVGYCYTQTASNYPIGVKQNADGAFFIYGSANGNGADWYSVDSNGTALSIQLIVEGDFAPNSVQPLDLGTIKVGLGKTKNVKVTLRNLGSKLSNIDYTIALDGKAGAEQHLDFGKDFGVGGKHTVEIPFAAAPTTGEVPVTLTITKVNGEKNANTSNSASGTLITLGKAFKKVTVVEENTGTTCPWCSRGHVAMEKMGELYGDQFIGIAWHYFDSSDPMYFVNYSVPGLSYGSAPLAVVNRSSSAMDPYFNAISAVATTLDDLPVVEVKVTGTFAEEDTKVNAKASVESLVSGDYNIVYALVADGLTGTTNKWKQKNAYSKIYAGSNGANSKSDLPEDLQPLWDAGETYFATFNDILIASSYTKSKNNATLPTLVANGVVNSEYTLSMPTSTKIKSAIKKDKVYVVAMVLDKKGAIINAAKSLVTNSTGIENVNNSTEATVVARYNVNGVQIAAPVKGINIVKMSDGTTRKVLVK
mgnify:FL=1